MASKSKKTTTMAKLRRENALRERRLEKQAKRDARRQAAAADTREVSDPRPGDPGSGGDG